jgi:DNA-directed RNA polymerase specialized sigma24 family protein
MTASECLGPADAVIPVVEALAATLPQLQSPILRLVKERNEARELVQRMMLAVEGAPQAEYYETMLAAHRALQSWKGGAK